MKFSFELSEQELEKFSWGSEGKFELTLNGNKFEGHLEQLERVCSPTNTKGYLRGFAIDKKAIEIAQAKAEVNRTREAHKEAQRKLSALMEEENVK